MNVFELTKQYAWLIGNAYAFQPKKGKPWVRVLLETYFDDKRKVFFVDSGLRLTLKPDMILHELPDRFVFLLNYYVHWGCLYS